MFTVTEKMKPKGTLQHFAEGDETLCGKRLGVGSGLRRDGIYNNVRMCSVCSLKAIVGRAAGQKES